MFGLKGFVQCDSCPAKNDLELGIQAGLLMLDPSKALPEGWQLHGPKVLCDECAAVHNKNFKRSHLNVVSVEQEYDTEGVVKVENIPVVFESVIPNGIDKDPTEKS